MRTIAVDWSGRVVGARRAIWLAEAHGGRVHRLEDGRTRDEVAEHLLDLAAVDPTFVVGADFSFSLPAWFLESRGFTTVDELWAAATHLGESWLTCSEPPFWGRPGARRPALPEHFRRTELAVGDVGGIRPKSTFQVAGAGSVGAGSIRGFPILARLRAAGFSVWPFDDLRPPAIVEIWPRVLTGAVVKRDAIAREHHLVRSIPSLAPQLRVRAIGSEDAFDAVVAASVMARNESSFATLRQSDDSITQLEGAVWFPGVDQASAAVSLATDASTSGWSSGSTSDESTV
jgi:hypothetical protein